MKLIWQFTPTNRSHETQPVPQIWSLENPFRLKGLDKVVHGVVENLDLLQHFFFEHFNRREELGLDRCLVVDGPSSMTRSDSNIWTLGDLEHSEPLGIVMEDVPEDSLDVVEVVDDFLDGFEMVVDFLETLERLEVLGNCSDDLEWLGILIAGNS